MKIDLNAIAQRAQLRWANEGEKMREAMIEACVETLGTVGFGVAVNDAGQAEVWPAGEPPSNWSKWREEADAVADEVTKPGKIEEQLAKAEENTKAGGKIGP